MLALPLLLACAASPQFAEPFLLHDLVAEPLPAGVGDDSNPTGGLLFEGDLLVGASGQGGSRALWRIDGQDGSAVPLTPEWVSDPSTPLALDSQRAVFYMTRKTPPGLFYRELWITDGSFAGTNRVAPSVLVPGSSIKSGLELFDGRVWFVVGLPDDEGQLWSSDGTEAGTRLEVDFQPGVDGAETGKLEATGSHLFASVKLDGVSKLFSLTGSGQPAVFLGDYSVALGSDRRQVLGNELWFYGSEAGSGTGSELCASDGTAAGTRTVLDIEPGPEASDVRFLPFAGGTVFFAAERSDVGKELWTSDGSSAGTTLLADLVPGSANGLTLAYGHALPDGRLLFNAWDAENDATLLFTSDGTAAGTLPLFDFEPLGLQLYGLAGFATLGDRVYFWIGNGPQVWSTDGSTAGTVPETGLLPPGVPSSPGEAFPIAVSDRIWFGYRSDATGSELWTTDGTPQGTEEVVDLTEPVLTAYGYPRAFLRGAQDLYFLGRTDGTFGTSLYATDGTVAGSREIESALGSVELFKSQLTLGNRLLLTASSPSTGNELWATEGATGALQLVADLKPGPLSSGASNFMPLGSIALFRASGAEGLRLYRTDGSPSGTFPVNDFTLEKIIGEPNAPAQLDGRALFFAEDGSIGFKLWSASGEPNDMLEIRAWKAFSSVGLPRNLQRFGPWAVFSAWTQEQGSGLFRTDGTPPGTRLVVNAELLGGSAIGEAVALDDVVVFTLDEDAVYATDGSQAGTVLLEDFSSLVAGPASPRELTRVGDRVAWIADTSSSGEPEGFWVTDGTPAGTEQVLLPGDSTFAAVDNDGFGGPFLELGGGPELVVVARTDATGLELWRWSEGTVPALLPELRPGPNSSLPILVYDTYGGFDPVTYWLAEIGGRLVFTGFDPAVGIELFAYDLAGLGSFGSETFGVGCAVLDPLAIDGEGAALPGNAWTLTLEGALPGATALAFYGQGIVPIPLGGGCETYLASPKLLAATVTDGVGAAAVDVQLPASAALSGVQFSLQWLAARTGGPLLGEFELSPGLELVPGG